MLIYKLHQLIYLFQPQKYALYLEQLFLSILRDYRNVFSFKKLLILPGLTKYGQLQSIAAAYNYLRVVELHNVSYSNTRHLFKHKFLQELSILNYKKTFAVGIRELMRDFQDLDHWFPVPKEKKRGVKLTGREGKLAKQDSFEGILNSDLSNLRKLCFTNVIVNECNQNKFLFACTRKFPCIEEVRSNGDPVHVWTPRQERDLGSTVYKLRELTLTPETFDYILTKSENYRHLTSVNYWLNRNSSIIDILLQIRIEKITFAANRFSPNLPEDDDRVFDMISIAKELLVKVLPFNLPVRKMPLFFRLTSFTIDAGYIEIPQITTFIKMCENLEELVIEQRHHGVQEFVGTGARISDWPNNVLKIFKFRSFCRDVHSYATLFLFVVNSCDKLEEVEITAKEPIISLSLEKMTASQTPLKILSLSTEESTLSQEIIAKVEDFVRKTPSLREVRLLVDDAVINNLKQKFFNDCLNISVVRVYTDPNFATGLRGRFHYTPT